MLRRSSFQMMVDKGIVSEPFQYIDALEGKKHIILVYEDQIEGKLIQFKFLKNGLHAGESCFYMTHEDPHVIEKEMRESGVIDVSTYLKKDLLHIHQIPDISTEMSMEVQYVLEKTFHSRFEGVDGSVLCYYDWSQMGGNRLRWIEKLARTHHAIIFATGFKRGMAFNL